MAADVQSNTAPGKIVFWGEYAVLADAPAWVMAVDRYVEVSLALKTDLQIVATGFDTPAVKQEHLEYTGAPVAGMIETILKHWGYAAYPDYFHVRQNTQYFYRADSKLGIGSSAALCVALYRTLAEQLDQPTSLAEVTAIHKRFQGNSGSGLDVAASWHGGLIRFHSQQAVQQQNWPSQLKFCVVFTGHSAATSEHVGSFTAWRNTSPTTALDNLCNAAHALDQGFNLTKLASYRDALVKLDQDAQLNIFTPDHRTLLALAEAHDVCYKPCGAGGGDIGVAFANDPSALANFQLAAEAQYTVIDVKLAPVTVT